MRAVKYMDEEVLIKKAVKALIGELGPIEANRFISIEEGRSCRACITRGQKTYTGLILVG